jgi:hypothetical protein
MLYDVATRVDTSSNQAIGDPGQRRCGYSNLGKIVTNMWLRNLWDVCSCERSCRKIPLPDILRTLPSRAKSALCLITVPSSQSSLAVSCRFSNLEKPHKIWNGLRHLNNNGQLAQNQSVVYCKVSSKMKGPSRSVYLRNASGLPDYATQPRGRRLRSRRQILLAISPSTAALHHNLASRILLRIIYMSR